uniref:Cingulin-like protein 1 n=1 Tax=Phallusia mammillata TaxID=59560 RepID=A0A6F9D9R4_9ASCI|nr:cingulin-like protein 1 [Phallusia mammillata]
MDEIQFWIKETLDVETIPLFEETPETVAILQNLMKQHEENKKQNEIKERLMKREILEFSAEAQRRKELLSSVDMNPDTDLSPNLTKCLRSLQKCAKVLGSVQPTHASLACSMAAFLQTHDRTKLDIMKTKMLCHKLKQRNNDVKVFQDQLEKKLEELETSLSQEMKNAEMLQKSTKFHVLKKKEYQRQILKCEKTLKENGYSDKISHSELVKLGNKAKHLEEETKPHQLQLNSYKNLPPNVDRAKLLLQEKVTELKMLEDELHEIFNHISLVS